MLPKKRANIQRSTVGFCTSVSIIDAVASACEPLESTISALEASNSPTMHKAHPMLSWCRSLLSDLARETSDMTLRTDGRRVQDILKISIIPHDIYIVALLLHSLLRTCS